MISLVIAFRNEALHIEQLLNSIVMQSLLEFEVLLIDDHSDDNSYMLVQSFINNYQGVISFNLIESTSNGKKNALLQGVEKSIGDCLVFSDADCILPSNFIESYFTIFSTSDAQFIIGSVLFSLSHYSPLVLFQEIEQVFMMSVFKYCANKNKPIGCSGANFGIYKKCFQKDISIDVSSGDDMFQLLKAKENELLFCAIDSIVETSPMKNFNDFLQQRLRWFRKMLFVKDVDITTNSIYILLLFLVVYVALFYSLISFFITIFSIITLFLLADFYLTKKTRIIAFFSPVIILLYPFYIALIFILNTSTKLKWKGRDVTHRG